MSACLTRSLSYTYTGAYVMGVDHLRDPRLNKGLAFTLEERQSLGIHGLQPPRFKTQEEQLELCRITIQHYPDNLDKYLYLADLQDCNEKLFFRFLSENVEELMPIVYTPTVGLACQKFGLIYRRPRGLFITINDSGHCFEVIRNWPERDIKVIVVTDGERILGLGDLGACGMGIPVGKLSLCTALAGIDPAHCLPITLDVGTNNKTLLEDPLYIGLRHKRISGLRYDELVDEFMEAVVAHYGQNTLIQFEDFGNHNAFRFLGKYRTRYCMFNDDIQGTASVAVAGLKASLRVTGKKIKDYKFVFLGAGEAALGIANLVVKAMEREGLTASEGRDRVWMFDIDGLLAKGRPEGQLEGEKGFFAKDHAPTKHLKDLIEEIRPSVLIGAAAAPGAFSPDILKMMASFNERPIVFALSNPTTKAECTAEQAYNNTNGQVLFSSGSPFPKVEYKGKVYEPSQGNNAYIFPGVALGVILTGLHHVSEDIFLLAADVVASNVTDECLAKGRIYPRLNLIKECSLQIAVKICEHAYDKGLATVYPEPRNKREYILKKMYDYSYQKTTLSTWAWPRLPVMKMKPIKPVWA